MKKFYSSITHKSQWHSRQSRDPFVKNRQHYVSRASFKLIEMNQKYKIIKPGMHVLDLGSAPGGWSQVASEQVGPLGHICAIDLNEMDEIPRVHFIKGDLYQKETMDKIHQDYWKNHCHEPRFHVILSDMGHSFSGNPSMDVPRMDALVQHALYLCQLHLIQKGSFVVKYLRGASEKGIF